MNQQQVQEAFDNITSKKSWWQRFTGSQFAQGISLFVGQVVYVVIQAAEKALGEAFLSTATKRSSILALAEDKAYRGLPITPSFGTVTVKNKSDRTLNLPANMHVISRNQLVYLFPDPMTLAAGAEKEAKILQYELVEVSKKVTAEVQFMSVLLPKDITAKASKVDVYIDENGRRVKWEKSFMFRASNSESRIYTEFYRPTEQLGIRFGNGINGKIPPAGSTITLHVWCTDGETMLLDGQTLTPIDGAEDLADLVTITTKTPITGGAPAESTEATRMGAMYCTPYDNQIVWDSDYRHFIKTHIGGLAWLNVWGEAEEEESTGIMDVANINSIFISGHKPSLTQQALEEEIWSLLDTIPDKLNKHFKYRQAKYVPFTINLTGRCATHLKPEEVKAKLIAALNDRFGLDANRFPRGVDQLELDPRGVKEKDLWATIEATGLLTIYTIDCVGQMVPTMLHDLIYLDLEASTVEVTY